MRLEFANRLIPEHLYRELGFAAYLDLFITSLDILPAKILRPLTEGEALAHFARLNDIQDHFCIEEIEQFLDIGKEFANLDGVLDGYEIGRMEQYHLFELGRFLHIERQLIKDEKIFPLDQDQDWIFSLLSILTETMGNDFSNILGNEQVIKLRLEIEEIETVLQSKLFEHDKQIFLETGLNMIFPWPKEISSSRNDLAIIQKCKLVKAEKQGELWLIHHTPQTEIAALNRKRETIVAQLEKLMQEIIFNINLRLKPYYSRFAAYYIKRQQRIWQYLLLVVKNKYDLILPRFQKEPGCVINGANIWQMKDFSLNIRREIQRDILVLYPFVSEVNYHLLFRPVCHLIIQR